MCGSAILFIWARFSLYTQIRRGAESSALLTWRSTPRMTKSSCCQRMWAATPANTTSAFDKLVDSRPWVFVDRSAASQPRLAATLAQHGRNGVDRSASRSVASRRSTRSATHRTRGRAAAHSFADPVGYCPRARDAREHRPTCARRSSVEQSGEHADCAGFTRRVAAQPDGQAHAVSGSRHDSGAAVARPATQRQRRGADRCITAHLSKLLAASVT